MKLVKIEKKDLAIIKQNDVTVKKIEELFLEKSWGMVFVTNDYNQLIGYYSISSWKKGYDLKEVFCVAPYFRSESEILNVNSEYYLYPLVDEKGCIICAYLKDENSEIIAEQMGKLLEIQRFNYNLKHYLYRSGCKGKKVALFTDCYRYRNSLAFGEMLSECSYDIIFQGVYVCKRDEKFITEDTLNLNCELKFINSIDELLNLGIDILFFNTAGFSKAEDVILFNEKNVKCRDLGGVLRAICNKYFTDYSIIKYKKIFKKKDIKLLTMAIPTERELGDAVLDKEKGVKASPEKLMIFLKKHMNAKDAIILNKARCQFLVNQVKDGELRYYNDISSEFLNIISKCRYVINQPQDYVKTVYLVGSCLVAGHYVKDENTLGTYMQKKFNAEKDKIRVVALAMPNGAYRETFFNTVLSLEPEKGDIIVYIDQTVRFIRYDIDCINEYKNLVKEQGRDIYYDIPLHCSSVVMQMVASKLCDCLSQNKINQDIYEKEYEEFFGEIPNEIANNKKQIGTLDNNLELKEYKAFLRKNAMASKIVNGAIVMNCNPFTFGHQYLIEYAAKKVDYLYIFVVQEDKSYFKFDDRIHLVREGTKHLKNVKVIPSGKFIISSTTFSEYFDKANLKGTTIDTSMDVEIFGEYIAPELDISVRFVGEEPLDPITNQYNTAMKKILPRFGIELVEIPRKTEEEEVISASRVRKLLENEEWDQLEKLVPVTTYEFLVQKFQ